MQKTAPAPSNLFYSTGVQYFMKYFITCPEVPALTVECTMSGKKEANSFLWIT